MSEQPVATLSQTPLTPQRRQMAATGAAASNAATSGASDTVRFSATAHFPLRSIERSLGLRSCNEWREKGECSYGDKCKYPHEREAMAPSFNRQQYSSRSYASQSSSQGTGSKESQDVRVSARNKPESSRAGADSSSSSSSNSSSHDQSPFRSPDSKWYREHTSANYLGNTLRGVEARQYNAAGVMVYKRDSKDGSLHVLFGRERIKNKRDKSGRLNFLGGKAEKHEKATETAARELWEETGMLLAESPAVLQDRIERDQVMWYKLSRYVLFFLELHDEHEKSICERYAALRSGVSEDAVEDTDQTEMMSLHWVALPTLLDFLWQDTQRFRGSQQICDDTVETIDGGRFPMVSFAVCVTRDAAIRAKLQNLALQPRQQPLELAAPQPVLGLQQDSKLNSRGLQLESELAASKGMLAQPEAVNDLQAQQQVNAQLKQVNQGDQPVVASQSQLQLQPPTPIRQLEPAMASDRAHLKLNSSPLWFEILQWLKLKLRQLLRL